MMSSRTESYILGRLLEGVCVRCGVGCASEDVLSIEAAYSTKHQAGLGVCASSGSEQ